VTTRDPRPTPPVPLPAASYDPAQLSFGDVAAVPQLRVDQQGEERGDPRDGSSLGFREPPVCGESSYDDVEDSGPSWSVRIVQEVESAPAAQRARQASPPRPATAAAPAQVRPTAARATGGPGAASATPAAENAQSASARPPAPMRTTGTHPLPAAMTAPMRPTPTAIPSAALDPLKRSTELSPRDAEAAIAYASALDKHGNAAAALTALDECLARGGDEVRLICARAFLLGNRLKYDLAEAELKRAMKLRADDPEVQLQSGILLGRRARWRDAVEPLQKAAAQRPDDSLAHFYLGEALNHVDQLAAALQAYERATQLDPANWRAFKGVGIVLDRLGRPTDAAVAYRHMREAQGR